jgi:hypothetical protein
MLLVPSTADLQPGVVVPTQFARSNPTRVSFIGLGIRLEFVESRVALARS